LYTPHQRRGWTQEASQHSPGAKNGKAAERTITTKGIDDEADNLAGEVSFPDRPRTECRRRGRRVTSSSGLPDRGGWTR
jgi:hypothetical protein